MICSSCMLPIAHWALPTWMLKSNLIHHPSHLPSVLFLAPPLLRPTPVLTDSPQLFRFYFLKHHFLSGMGSKIWGHRWRLFHVLSYIGFLWVYHETCRLPFSDSKGSEELSLVIVGLYYKKTQIKTRKGKGAWDEVWEELTQVSKSSCPGDLSRRIQFSKAQATSCQL